MWKLTFEKEGIPTARVHYVLIDKELTVGRKDCDILISGDASVSRKHATLRASHPIGNIRNVDKRPLVTLRDGSSKYGCFINGKQVGSEGVLLTHNDTITFGQCGSNFHVVYKPLVVTTSCVDSSSKASLKEDVRKLGGHVVDEWTPSCTHLAMTGIKVTVKTVCALICQTPIVQPEYFKMYRKSRDTCKEPEVASKFLPPVNEALLDSSSINFHVEPVRKEIFKNKCFIFLSTKQYVKLKLPISLGGGESILLNHRESNVTTKMLLSSCVVDCPVGASSSASQVDSEMCSQKEIEDICTILRKFKKRLIPESDIGLAVVHCSTESFCNPDIELDESIVDVKIQSQTLSQSYMHNIIPETANSVSSHSLFGESLSQIVTTIPETEQPGSSKHASTSSKSQVEPPYNQSSIVLNKKRSLESPTAIAEEPSPKLLKPDNKAVADVKEEPPSPPPIFDTPVFTRNEDNQSQVHFQADTQVFTPSLFKDETQEFVTEERSTATGIGEVSRDCVETKRQRPNFEDTGPTETVREGGESKKQKRNSEDTLPTDNLREVGESKKQKRNSEDIEHRRTSTEPEETKRQRRNSEDMEADSNNGEIDEIISKSPVTVRKQQRSIDIQVPFGFLHSKKKPLVVTCKEEPDALQEINILSNLVVVKMANLTVKNTNRGKLQANAVGASDPSVKNFKKFRKTANAGAHQLPRIIGGSDLLVFQRKEAQADMEWLLEQETENSQEDLENNTSFNVPIRKRPRM